MIWDDWDSQMVKDSRERGEGSEMALSRGLKGHGCQNGMENNFPAVCVAASMVYRSGIAVV